MSQRGLITTVVLFQLLTIVIMLAYASWLGARLDTLETKLKTTRVGVLR